jgi:hypothetical protein
LGKPTAGVAQFLTPAIDLPGTNRRAPGTSATIAPGANAASTIARFCSSLHDRRRSGPVIISILAILASFALLQTPVLAPVRTSGLNRSARARRPSPEAYASSGIRAEV